MRSLRLAIILLGLLALGPSCKKDHPAAPPPPPSSQKVITTFQLRKADNTTALAIDETGVIGNDTILVTIPAQSPRTALVPYFTYTGKSVFPTSGTAEDFSSGVQYKITADDGSTKIYTVIVRNRTAFYLTTSDGKLASIDPATTLINWTYQLGISLLSAPTIGDGLVFFTSNSGLYAVNAVDGSLAWTISFISLNDPFNLLIPSPAYSIPIPVYQAGVVYGSFGDGTIRAIDAKTGSVRWSYPTSYPFVGGPTLFNGNLYVGSVDGYIYSLNQSSGTLNWKFKGKGDPIVENPLAANNAIYVGSQGSDFYALQAATGQLIWKTTDYFENCSPSGSNGVVYSSPENEILAINPETGGLNWYATHNTGGVGWNGMPSVYPSGNKLFVASLDGHVYAHDTATGNLLWSYYLGSMVISSPVVANGRVYIGATSGNFAILNAADGTVISTTNFGPYPSGVCIIDSINITYHPPESGEQN